jgi:hypothetical protein
MEALERGEGRAPRPAGNLLGAIRMGLGRPPGAVVVAVGATVVVVVAVGTAVAVVVAVGLTVGTTVAVGVAVAVVVVVGLAVAVGAGW